MGKPARRQRYGKLGSFRIFGGGKAGETPAVRELGLFSRFRGDDRALEAAGALGLGSFGVIRGGLAGVKSEMCWDWVRFDIFGHGKAGKMPAVR